MNKIVTLSLLLLFGAFCAHGQQQDPLLQLLKQELRYNMEELKKQDQPPYYMNLRVEDAYQVSLVGSFGAALVTNEVHVRTLVPQIRLGSPELDNFKYNSQGMMGMRGAGAPPITLPLEDSYSDAIRQAIWLETLKRYDFLWSCLIKPRRKQQQA